MNEEQKKFNDNNKAMRLRSGSIDIDSKLVSFLYQLLRDHITTGDIEKIVRESETESKCQYTNGWLAKYAEDIAKRLSDK